MIVNRIKDCQTIFFLFHIIFSLADRNRKNTLPLFGWSDSMDSIEIGVESESESESGKFVESGSSPSPSLESTALAQMTKIHQVWHQDKKW